MRLALHGGPPVRTHPLPYGHQWIDDADIAAVTSVLRSEWLTTGPIVEQFEQRLATLVGARQAVAMSSGTASLHATIHALGIGSGDEVIVPAITFVATATCVIAQGATPVIADVNPQTLLLDPDQAELKITPRTKAIIAVDYAGQACEYDRLRQLANNHGLKLVADACHSLGGRYRNRPVGSLADLTVFSFHPVKIITTGEGGAVATNSPELATRMRRFRNHGVSNDSRQREQTRSWYYEMIDMGSNYRLTDLQCALGVSQLDKLHAFLQRRQAIAQRYHAAFAEMPELSPLVVRPEVEHAYHLYVIRLHLERLRTGRAEIFAALRAEGIGVNIHYLPVHLHHFYQTRLGAQEGCCPVAESMYERILTLPLYPSMTGHDVDDVIEAVQKVISYFREPAGVGV